MGKFRIYLEGGRNTQEQEGFTKGKGPRRVNRELHTCLFQGVGQRLPAREGTWTARGRHVEGRAAAPGSTGQRHGKPQNGEAVLNALQPLLHFQKGSGYIV